MRRPAGAAPDDEGTDGEVSLDSGLGCLEAASPPGADELGSPTVSGGRALVRLAPEVWPDAEAGSGTAGLAAGRKMRGWSRWRWWMTVVARPGPLPPRPL